ncbi:MAG: hypothetical protein KBC48_00740 [Candidatus Pacebacteria bacterium]|nr:hypothetical protein [Candidatus Paceibacterota bacterium]
MKNKLYLKILGLLIIVGGASAYYYWPQISWLFEIPEPAQDKEEEVREMVYQERPKDGEVQILPTADPKWNLYRNFKYGFQIQYPSDWEFIKIFKNNVSGDIFVGFSPYGVDSKIVLNIYHDLDLDSYLNKFELKNDIKFEKITLNSKDVFKIFTVTNSSDHRGYFFEVNGISYALGGGGDESTLWYIDRMMETLEVF